MNDHLDPVDTALGQLADRQWDASGHKTALEKELMSNFQANTKSGGRHRHRVLLACAAVLIVASVGFAAAGGLEIVRGWFTVTTAVNGEVVDVQTVTTDEDGKARFAMPDIDDPGELSFTVGGEVVGPTDANTATIDIAVQDGVGEMTVTYDEPEED